MTIELLLGPEIGRGGFAVVRPALDRATGRMYAWKELLEEHRREPYATALHAEAWILSEVAHPMVPRVYGYLRERHAYLMDLLTAVSLDTLIPVWSRVPLAVRFRVLVDLADAINLMHRKGLLHLDVKLANLMVTPYGTTFLIDFGVAAMHWVRQQLGRAIDIPATPQYSPPERFETDYVPDPRSDVYGLGVTGYILLTGRRPYNVASGKPHELRAAVLDALRSGRVQDPSELEPALPRGLGSLLLRCMSADPEERPRHAGELIRALVREAGDLRPASDAECQAWAAEMSGEIVNRLPPPWHGEGPEGTVAVPEACFEIVQPSVPRIVSGPSAAMERVRVPGEVEISWTGEEAPDGYQLRVREPNRARPTMVRVSAENWTLPVRVPGAYTVAVRGLAGELGGPWSDEVRVEAYSVGRRWAVATALAVGLAVTVSAWLILGIVPEEKGPVQAAAVPAPQSQPENGVDGAMPEGPGASSTPGSPVGSEVPGARPGEPGAPRRVAQSTLHPSRNAVAQEADVSSSGSSRATRPELQDVEAGATASTAALHSGSAAGGLREEPSPPTATPLITPPTRLFSERQADLPGDRGRAPGSAEGTVPLEPGREDLPEPAAPLAGEPAGASAFPATRSINLVRWWARLIVSPSNLTIVRVNGWSVETPGYSVVVEGSKLRQGENWLELADGRVVTFELGGGALADLGSGAAGSQKIDLSEVGNWVRLVRLKGKPGTS